MSSHTTQGHGMHIWELFDRFYSMKHGRQFSKQPSMMLSEAFAMDVGCTQQTPKQVIIIIISCFCILVMRRLTSFTDIYLIIVLII